MRYRLPRPGDIFAVRSNNPGIDETTVVVETVADNGGYLLVAGRWGEHNLEVVFQRIGDHTLQHQE